MVFLATSEEWQRQSTLLLQARPTTTRITTKYTIPNLEAARFANGTKRKRTGAADEDEDEEGNEKGNAAAAAAAGPRVPRAALVLKTYDPASGACLQFRTERAADLGRLIAGLGRLGRHMAALPEQAEGLESGGGDGGGAHDAQGGAMTAATMAARDPALPPVTDAKAQPTSGGGGAGAKKKKKGKK